MFGLETQVEIGLQADPTTFNTTARRSLNVYKISGGRTSTRPEDPILGGNFANLTDPTEPGPGLPDHKLTIEAPVCIAQMPFWLRAFFGAPETTGTTPDYEHEFKSGVSTLPYIALQHRLQANDYRRHVGLVGEEFRISFNPEADGFARFSMSFMGIDEQRDTAAAAGTVTAAPTLDRPAEAASNVAWNGVAGGQIIGGELTFKRKLKRIRSADGTGLASAIEYDGKSTLSGSIKLRYRTQSIIQDAWSRTERVVAMELMRAAERGLQFQCGHAVLDEAPIDISGPDGVEFDLPLNAYQSATDVALLIAALSGTASFATLTA